MSIFHCSRCGARYGQCELCDETVERHVTGDFITERAADGCDLCEVCDDIHHGRVETYETTDEFIAALKEQP